MTIRSLSIFLFVAAAAVWSQDSGIANLPDSLMATGTKMVWVKKLPFYCEGPAVDKNGILYFDQQMDNGTQAWPIWKIDPADPADTGMVFLRNSSQANGLNFDKDWRLVVCQNQKITRFETGGATTILAASGNGAVFGQANDMSIGSSGAMYFTDLGKNVYYVDGTGKTKIVYSQAGNANGIEWIEEKNQVNLNQIGGVTRFQAAADGSLSNPTSIITVNGPDGSCMDEHGNVFVASYIDGAIDAFNAAGTRLGDITLTATGVYDTRPGKAGNVDNCTFGGPDNKTLYITGDGGAYSLRMKIAGRRIAGMSTALFGNHHEGNHHEGKNQGWDQSQRAFSGFWIGAAGVPYQGFNLSGRKFPLKNGFYK